MKRVVWILGIFAAIWVIYWFGVRSFGNSVIEKQLNAARSEGWQIETDLHVSGFPLRFNTNGEKLQAERDGTTLEVVQPNAAVWAIYPVTLHTEGPWSARLEDGERQLMLKTETLEADVTYGIISLGALKRSTGSILELELSDMTQSQALTVAIDALDWDLDDGAGDNLYGLTMTGQNITLNGLACAGCPGPDTLGIAQIHLDAQARFDAPINLLDTANLPRLEQLFITDAKIGIFEGSVHLSGDLTYDAQGLATGTLTARVENWGNILSGAEKGGWIEIERARLLRNVLRPLATNHSDVELPLVVRSGAILLGPVPLGQFPPLAIAQAQG